MTRGEFEVLEGRPLPTIYLRATAAEDGAPRFVSGHALMCRENGFMIALPDVELVHATLAELVTPDGVPLSLSLEVELPCETVRGRRLGPGALLEHFVRTHPLRAALAGGGTQRLTVLQVEGALAGAIASEALRAAHAWIDNLDPETAQEYISAAEPPPEDDELGEGPVPEIAEVATGRPGRFAAMGEAQRSQRGRQLVFSIGAGRWARRTGRLCGALRAQLLLERAGSNRPNVRHQLLRCTWKASLKLCLRPTEVADLDLGLEARWRCYCWPCFGRTQCFCKTGRGQQASGQHSGCTGRLGQRVRLAQESRGT